MYCILDIDKLIKNILVITTGDLEVYHSAMLKYTQKRLHFTYNTMKARTQLSVMDHNSNVGREHATTSDGKYNR